MDEELKNFWNLSEESREFKYPASAHMHTHNV
jgi:hypothetical protein